MNTQQLAAVLELDEICKGLSTSVCGRDEMIETPFDSVNMMISNMDNSDQPGSHWVALYKQSETTVEYFDSYGYPPLHLDVEHYLSSAFVNIIFNPEVIQGSNTSVCGQYCLVYLLLRARGYSMENIITVLRNCDSSEQRDHSVNLFINIHFSDITKTNFRTHDFSFISNNQNISTKCFL